jgi:hypothetical protein
MGLFDEKVLKNIESTAEMDKFLSKTMMR